MSFIPQWFYCPRCGYNAQIPPPVEQSYYGPYNYPEQAMGVSQGTYVPQSSYATDYTFSSPLSHTTTTTSNPSPNSEFNSPPQPKKPRPSCDELVGQLSTEQLFVSLFRISTPEDIEKIWKNSMHALSDADFETERQRLRERKNERSWRKRKANENTEIMKKFIEEMDRHKQLNNEFVEKLNEKHKLLETLHENLISEKCLENLQLIDPENFGDYKKFLENLEA